ncbi:MAG: 30S ribosomal protein S4 [Planctomycetia bacterium]|nr:30S ribosomal protein S4 [Planctomycetia bacterium]
MARTIDPVCKMCRREGIKLYLKGARCESPKCAIDRRNVAPGMHGYRRGKTSEYGLRLRMKQKLKRFYGVMERQFRRLFALASRSPENTGEVLMTLMERRLDNIVHRLGFATSRAGARQLVLHGHITLNGKRCGIPSLLLKDGETVAIKVRERSRRKGQASGEGSKRKRNAPALVRQVLQDNSNPPPDWLERISTDPPEGRVKRLPSRQDVDPRINEEINEQLIIEFCSR